MIIKWSYTEFKKSFVFSTSNTRWWLLSVDIIGRDHIDSYRSIASIVGLIVCFRYVSRHCDLNYHLRIYSIYIQTFKTSFSRHLLLFCWTNLFPFPSMLVDTGRWRMLGNVRGQQNKNGTLRFNCFNVNVIVLSKF